MSGDSFTIDADNAEYSTTVDTSGLTEVELSFDYDLSKLDGDDENVTITFSAGSKSDTETVSGSAGDAVVSSDTGTLKLTELGAEANLAISISADISGFSGAASDFITLSNITVSGDQASTEDDDGEGDSDLDAPNVTNISCNSGERTITLTGPNGATYVVYDFEGNSSELGRGTDDDNNGTVEITYAGATDSEQDEIDYIVQETDSETSDATTFNCSGQTEGSDTEENEGDNEDGENEEDTDNEITKEYTAPDAQVPDRCEATPVDELFIDASEENNAVDSSVLTAGNEYFVAVGGVYTFRDDKDGYLSDAEYITKDGFNSTENPVNSSGPDANDLIVDGADVELGAYASDHVYTTLLTGADAPVSFSISDFFNGPQYFDNEGGLSVAVYDCGKPAVGTPVEVPARCSVPFDSFDVQADDGSGQLNNPAPDAGEMSKTLANGVEYFVKVSGTAQWSNQSDDVFDAEYSSKDNFNTVLESDFQHDLLIDGAGRNDDADWGAYNSAHVYGQSIMGMGNPVQFSVYDNNHADNSGSLAVEIFECPKPVEPEPEICSAEDTAGKLISFTDEPKTNDGDPVADNRRDPNSVTLTTDQRNFYGKEPKVTPVKFFSLGIEGEAIFEFENKVVVDQPGDDIAIWEITWGDTDDQSDEKVIVSVSQDNNTYVEVETLTGDGKIDISGTGLDFVKYIKLKDDSRGIQGGNGDGYDLDYIGIIEGACQDEPVEQVELTCEAGSTLTEIATFEVDSSDFDGVTTDFNFENATDYLVEVSGIFNFGRAAKDEKSVGGQFNGGNDNRKDNVSDAEYSSWNDFGNNAPFTPAFFDPGKNNARQAHDLEIDNMNVDWGAYNAAHTYATIVTGDGNSKLFRVYEEPEGGKRWYNDNEGSLTVTVSSCVPDVVEVPVCEPGDAGYDPENDLTGVLTGTGEGKVTNTSDVCAYEIGLASYKKFDEVIDNQELFDSATGTVGANSMETLTIDVPQCAYQIDLFYGEVLESLDGQRYGTRLLAASHEGGTNYCDPGNNGGGGGGAVDTGTLRVCKVLVNESGDIIDGGNAEFSVALTGANFSDTAVFTNLSYDTDLFNEDEDSDDSSVNDAQCVSFEVKPGPYQYAEEVINAGQSTFGAPMYHDGFNGVADELSDMMIFNTNNIQSDGNVSVKKGKTRTIVVKNTLEGDVLGEDTATTTVNVMKHICNAAIKDLADFESTDGPDANQTTEFHDKVLACPTVVMEGDDYTDGLAFDGKRAFDFEVKGDEGETQTIADATFVPGKVCETDINFDANGDGTIDANTCFDTSLYSYTDVSAGNITVTELVSPTGRIGGALEFTPAALNGGFDEAVVLTDSNRFDDGVVEIDSTLDNDGVVTLHLYNFLEVGEPQSPLQCTADVSSILYIDTSVDGTSELFRVDTNGNAVLQAVYSERFDSILAANLNDELFSTKRDGTLVKLEKVGTVGTSTDIGQTGLPKPVAANFAPNGTLYVIDQDVDQLYTVSTVDASATQVVLSATLSVDGGDLVVNDDNNLIYLKKDGTVFQIDLDNGNTLTTLGALSAGAYTSMALENGVYYAFNKDNDEVVSFTITNGVVTEEGSSAVTTAVEFGDATSCVGNQAASGTGNGGSGNGDSDNEEDGNGNGGINNDDDDDDNGSTASATRLGGRGGSGGGSSDDSTPDGSVLGVSDDGNGGDFPLVQGNQVSVFPAGAPNTGAGGAAATPNYVVLFALLGLLVLAANRKQNQI